MSKAGYKKEGRGNEEMRESSSKPEAEGRLRKSGTENGFSRK